MVIKALRLSEFARLSPDEQRERLAAFSAARNQPLNGELAVVSAQIAELEKRYEMSSASMREGFNRGAIRETSEICHWLMLLDVQTTLAGKQ